jgi:hypothetical protein
MEIIGFFPSPNLLGRPEEGAAAATKEMREKYPHDQSHRKK